MSPWIRFALLPHVLYWAFTVMKALLTLMGALVVVSSNALHCSRFMAALLFIALHPPPSVAHFTYKYLADDASSLSTCTLFLPRNTLPFILP